MHHAGDHESNAMEVGALTKEIRVRLLNCSAAGCLLETNAAVPVGTVAVLRVVFGDREFDDTIQVVRHQFIQGAGELHYVGAKFVLTAPPYVGSLRYFMHTEPVMLAAWLRTAG